MNLASQHMPLVMDEVDARLVSLLRQDGRTPYRTMALELNLTEATVRRGATTGREWPDARCGGH